MNTLSIVTLQILTTTKIADMKKVIFSLAVMLCSIACMTAQEKQQQSKKRNFSRHFSHEEFQAKQKEYITRKAQLTPEEAEAFFPLFFELQKKKFTLERDARRSIKKKRGEKMNEEQCREFVNKMSDVKIEVAKLEKEYSAKYLNVIPACKLLGVQHAEISFQRDLMKKMMQERGHRQKGEHKPNEKR